jgi:hypothetical protein
MTSRRLVELVCMTLQRWMVPTMRTITTTTNVTPHPNRASWVGDCAMFAHPQQRMTRKVKKRGAKTMGHHCVCPVAWVCGVKHQQHASQHPYGLGMNFFGRAVRHNLILTENRVRQSCQRATVQKQQICRIHPFLRATTSSEWHRDRPPVSHTKGTGKG